MNRTRAVEIIIQPLWPGPGVEASAPPLASGTLLVTYASRFARRASTVGVSAGAGVSAPAMPMNTTHNIHPTTNAETVRLMRMTKTLPGACFQLVTRWQIVRTSEPRIGEKRKEIRLSNVHETSGDAPSSACREPTALHLF